jgi:hypothetical protein
MKCGLDSNDFRRGIRQGFVLSFSAGTRYRGLFTSTSSNQVRTKKHGKSSDRATIINIVSLINIRKGTKKQIRVSTYLDTKTTRAMQIAKDELNH